MNVPSFLRRNLATGACVLALLLAGCAGSSVSIKVDGSSTVFPIAEAWAEAFGPEVGARVTVSSSGTGGGFQKFCRGEIDVSDASRPIKETERNDCASRSITAYEIQVAIDGLAVVVHPSNSFVDHLSVTELNRIWTDNTTQAKTWKDVRDAWPDEEIKLFGPGTNSGTFDYFVEVIITPFDGTSSKGRSDYTPSEDDNVLVRGVSSDNDALGYFGLAYARENSDKVKIVPIVDDGPEGKNSGPVLPTDENVESGTYSPLARPLLMYTNGRPMGALQEWLKLGLSDEGQDLVSEVGYVRMSEAVLNDQRGKLDAPAAQ